MGMNSFSNRKDSSRTRRLDEDLSAILKVHNDGDEFTVSCFRDLKNVELKPIDLEAYKKEWLDPDKGRRSAPRYALEMTVLVCNHKKAFRTKTENISAAGFLLKDVLPLEFSNRSFEVILINEADPQHKTYLLFRGKAVEGPLRSNRIILEGAAAANEQKLYELTIDLTVVK